MDINGHLKDVSLRKVDTAEGRAAMEGSSEKPHAQFRACTKKKKKKKRQTRLCEGRTVLQIHTERCLKMATSMSVLIAAISNHDQNASLMIRIQ